MLRLDPREGLALHQVQPALISANVKAKRRGRSPRRLATTCGCVSAPAKQDVRRFLVDPLVPFSDDMAQLDGQMMKLRQKISGGFRSKDGAKGFGVIRSVLSTARKQGWHILQALTGDPVRMIAELRVG
jgi:transposase